MEYLSFYVLLAIMAGSSARSDRQWNSIFLPGAKPEISLISVGGISNWWPEVKKQAANKRGVSIQKILDRNGKIYLSIPQQLEVNQLEKLLKRLRATEAESNEHDYLRKNEIDMQWTPAEIIKFKNYLTEFTSDEKNDRETYSQPKNRYLREIELRRRTALAISKQLDTLKGLINRLIETVAKRNLGNEPFFNGDGPQLNQVEDNSQEYNELKNQRDDTSGEETNFLKEYFSNLVSDQHPQLRSGRKLKIRKQKKLQEKDQNYSKELDNLRQYLELPALSAETGSRDQGPPKVEYKLSELIG